MLEVNRCQVAAGTARTAPARLVVSRTRTVPGVLATSTQPPPFPPL
jgi:hypothetical protein